MLTCQRKHWVDHSKVTRINNLRYLYACKEWSFASCTRVDLTSVTIKSGDIFILRSLMSLSVIICTQFPTRVVTEAKQAHA